MRDFLREASEFAQECFPIVAIVTWLIIVIILVKLLISGAIR